MSPIGTDGKSRFDAWLDGLIAERGADAHADGDPHAHFIFLLRHGSLRLYHQLSLSH